MIASTTLWAAPNQLLLNRDENHLTAAVVDEVTGTAYVAVAPSDFRYSLETSSGTIARIRLSDLTRLGTIVLKAGENPVTTASIGPKSFGYFGVYGDPNRDISSSIVKVKLSENRRIASSSLGSHEYGISSAVIDSSGQTAYVGTLFGTVMSIRLADITPTSSIGLQRESHAFTCSVLDSNGDFGYFGTGTGDIAKISLRDFQPVASLNYDRPGKGFKSAFLGPDGQQAFFLMDSTPVTLVKVDLNRFRVADSVPIKEGSSAVAAFMHRDRQRGIVLLGGTTPQIALFDLATLSPLDMRDLPVEEGNLTLALYDPQRNDLVLAYDGTPALLVRIPIAP